jgi:hypothetical protein
MDMKNFSLSVSKKDIDIATRTIAGNFNARAEHCPVATAVRRKFPNVQTVRVGYTDGICRVRIDGIEYHLTRGAYMKVRQFDCVEKMEPFRTIVKKAA